MSRSERGGPLSAANLSLTLDSSFPSRVGAGVSVSVPITVTNNAYLILPNDEDYCWRNNRGGYDVEVAFQVAGADLDADSACIKTTQPESWTLSYTFSNPGEYDVSIVARGANSGRVVDSVSSTLTVEESDGSDDADDESDGSDDADDESDGSDDADDDEDNPRSFWAGLSATEKYAVLGGGTLTLVALTRQ